MLSLIFMKVLSLASVLVLLQLQLLPLSGLFFVGFRIFVNSQGKFASSLSIMIIIGIALPLLVFLFLYLVPKESSSGSTSDEVNRE